MSRTLSVCVVAVASLLSPACLMAGGPPYLCLPVEGVDAQNTPACVAQLSAKLQPLVLASSLKFVEYAGQCYLTFHLKHDARLNEVQTALEGTGLSLQRDKLRLFGHVLLEIDAVQGSHSALLAALEALPQVSVEVSKVQDNKLVVTVDMPYPIERRTEETVGWNAFQRSDLNSNSATDPRGQTTARQLPTLQTLRDAVAQHNATLKDLRWSNIYACRPLGCVALPAADLPAGTWNVTFSNGVTEVCDLANSDGGMATVAEPQRRSRGSVDVEGTTLLLTFEDERIERWTPVGPRFVVEHWFPGAAYPTGTPVLGIAERVP